MDRGSLCLQAEASLTLPIGRYPQIRNEFGLLVLQFIVERNDTALRAKCTLQWCGPDLGPLALVGQAIAGGCLALECRPGRPTVGRPGVRGSVVDRPTGQDRQATTDPCGSAEPTLRNRPFAVKSPPIRPPAWHDRWPPCPLEWAHRTNLRSFHTPGSLCQRRRAAILRSGRGEFTPAAQSSCRCRSWQRQRTGF